MRRLCFIGLTLGLQFFVESHGFRSGFPGGSIFFVFIGGFPIHQGVGNFLPFIAFRTKVAHPIRLLFPFGSELVRAVFQDEAFGELLGGGAKRSQTQARRKAGSYQQKACFVMDAKHV